MHLTLVAFGSSLSRPQSFYSVAAASSVAVRQAT
jgi:hypothetical protein